MKKYHYSWYSYIFNAFFFLLSEGLFEMHAYLLFVVYLLITFAVTANMLFTTLYVDSEGITKKNMLGTKVLLWEEITQIKKIKGRNNGIAGIKLIGLSKNLSVSIGINDFPELISDIISYKEDVYSDHSMNALSSTYSFQKKILIAIIIVSICLGVFFTSMIVITQNMKNSYEKRAAQYYEQLDKSENC